MKMFFQAVHAITPQVLYIGDGNVAIVIATLVATVRVGLRQDKAVGSLAKSE